MIEFECPARKHSRARLQGSYISTSCELFGRHVGAIGKIPDALLLSPHPIIFGLQQIGLLSDLSFVLDWNRDSSQMRRLLSTTVILALSNCEVACFQMTHS